MKLKVGDRVEAIRKVDGINLKGKRGVVRYVNPGGRLPVLVEFGKPFENGHEGEGRCKQGRGRWGKYADFKVIKTKRRKK